jgi:hypothetical protein
MDIMRGAPEMATSAVRQHFPGKWRHVEIQKRLGILKRQIEQIFQPAKQ